MKRVFKRLVEFIAHIKAFFKPYEEELIDGLDVEELIKGENAKERIETKVRENMFFHQQQKEEYEQFMNEYVIVDRVDNMTKDLKGKLQRLCRSYSELTVLKEDAERTKEMAKEKEHPAVHNYTKDIPKAIKILKEHEDNQQKVKNDLAILEGEKSSLVYQFRNLTKTSTFLRFFLLGLVFVSLITGITLATMLVAYGRNVFLPSLISIVSISFLFIWGFVFRRYCHHEIRKNQLMQERAVKLINKTKLKYVRNQQLLDFEYSKYKVNSSEVLVLRYDNYLEAVEQERNYTTVNNQMKAIIIDIDRFLNTLHLENIDFVLRKADYFASGRGIKTLKERYVSERETIQRELSRIEHEQQVLRNLLTNQIK